MSDYKTIAHVKTESAATVLIAALRAHGFHPRDIADGGFPGVRAAVAGSGIGIDVPGDEAADAQPLAEALIADMSK